MTANEAPDTINVDLPIAAHDDGYVKVDHVALATRERWREIAADPDGADTWSLTGTVAPAVVAWIERDEWEPLDLPEVGRTIKATLRDGSIVQFEVGNVNDVLTWAWIERAGQVADDEYYRIELTLNEDEHDLDDIVAWEYVDEPKSFAEMTTTERLAWIEETRAWLLARAER